MGTVPVICLAEDQGRGLVESLQRSGIRAPLAVLQKPSDLPPRDAYVVIDTPGVPTSRRLRDLTSKRDLLKRTVAFAPPVPARDISTLESLGIPYYCNSNAGIAQLFRLIGTIRADVLLDARERSEDAQATAQSIFGATASALDMFSRSSTFDRAFYLSLSDSFTQKMGSTSLFLVVDSISRSDQSTTQHCSLVTTLGTAFAAALSFPKSEVERIFLASFFHDIGKSAIPSAILNKPGKLTDEEMRLMRTHVSVGYELLRRFPETAGEIAEVALHHHEYLDGSGYPNGLRGSEIPDLVRIVTIADIFGALIERRSYKPPFPADQAFDMLVAMDAKLDQDLVGLFRPVAESIGSLR